MPLFEDVKIADAGRQEIVDETSTTFAFLGLYHHVNSGPTVMVSPKQHVENLYDIEENLLAEVIHHAKSVVRAMKSGWLLDGFPFGRIMNRAVIKMFGIFMFM